MWNQTVFLLSKPSSEDEKYTRFYTDFQKQSSELLHVIAFLDWNPPHLFLKCVEFCSAVSVKNSVKFMIIAASLGLLLAGAGAILQESPSSCLPSLLLASPSLQRDPWAECPRKTCFKFVMRSCLAFSWLGRFMSYYWKGTAHTAILGVTYPLSPCQLLATVIAEQQTIPAGSPASIGFKRHVLGPSALTSSSLQLKTSGKARLSLSGRNTQQIRNNHWFFAFISTWLRLLVFLGKKSHCPFLFWKGPIIKATWLYATSSFIFLLSKY